MMLRKERVYFWLISSLLVAFAVRCLAGWAVQTVVEREPGRICLIPGDADGYWILACKLARGEDFEIYEPPRQVLRMPGFPWILSLGIRCYGEHIGPTRVWLSLWGTLACGLVYCLAREFTDRGTACLATGLTALQPALVGFSPLILSETCFAVTVLINLIAAARLFRTAQSAAATTASLRWSCAGWSFLVGVTAAGACYVRPSWLLFPALIWLVCVLITRGKYAVVIGVGLILGGVLTLAPWIYRNYAVTGHFVPTTLWMGPSLYDGLNPEANGDSHMEFLQHDALYQQLSEYEVDRHYRRLAWQFVAEHPGRTLQLAGVKLLRFWNPFPNARQFDRWWSRLVLLSWYVPEMGFACLTLWWARRAVRNPAEVSEAAAEPQLTLSYWTVLTLCAGPVLYFSALHLLFVSSLRYRLPTEYPLLILTAWGLRWSWQRWRHNGVMPGA